MAFNYSPKIITDGLVLYLDAANTRSYPGSGTVWSDLSRGGNNGTLTNGPTFNAGSGGSIVFDGVNDYADFGINSQINSINTYTFSFILSSPSINANFRPIFTRSVSYIAGNSDIEIYGGNGGIQLVHNRSNGGTMFARLMNALPNNAIGFLDITYNSSTLEWRCYYNSNLTNTFTNIQPPLTNSSYISGIGRFWAGSSYFLGNIYSARIYNRALSATEILQNYNATKGRYGL